MVLNVLLTAIGTFIGTIAAIIFIPRLSSINFRKHHNIIDIKHTWKNEWFIDNTLYSVDFMIISKWLKNGKFEGEGINKKGDYKVLGEITSAQYLSATYQNINFPTVGYFGSFGTLVDVSGDSMEGYWQGRIANGKIRGGKLISTKTNKIAYDEIYESNEPSNKN
jgi:hypothetical protein